MPTRNVNLTEYYDGFIKNCLKNGRYKNASEVIRAGLAALEFREREDEIKLERLREELKKGIADIEVGRLTSIETDDQLNAFFDQIEQDIEGEAV